MKEKIKETLDIIKDILIHWGKGLFTVVLWIMGLTLFIVIISLIKDRFYQGFILGILSAAMLGYIIYESEKHKTK